MGGYYFLPPYRSSAKKITQLRNRIKWHTITKMILTNETKTIIPALMEAAVTIDDLGNIETSISALLYRWVADFLGKLGCRARETITNKTPGANSAANANHHQNVPPLCYL
jgi:hypothetical protein